MDELILDANDNISTPLALAPRKQLLEDSLESISSATARKQRFTADFRSPIIPFGAYATYKPSGEKVIEDMPKLGAKLREGIFVGYDQIVGGGWSGDLYVLDWYQLEASDAIHQVYVRRLKAEEGFAEKSADGAFRFPCATGELSQPTGATRCFRRFQRTFIADDEPDEMDAVEEDEEDEETSNAKTDAEDDEGQEKMEDKGDSEDILDRDPPCKNRGRQGGRGLLVPQRDLPDPTSQSSSHQTFLPVRRRRQKADYSFGIRGHQVRNLHRPREPWCIH